MATTEVIRVATQPYKITFKDGSVQTLPRVWRHYRDGPFLVFQDEDTEVLRVPAADVRSVVPTDTAEDERT
jgi:Leu/Phe-tRNA-protein transferase